MAAEWLPVCAGEVLAAEWLPVCGGEVLAAEWLPVCGGEVLAAATQRHHTLRFRIISYYNNWCCSLSCFFKQLHMPPKNFNLTAFSYLFFTPSGSQLLTTHTMLREAWGYIQKIVQIISKRGKSSTILEVNIGFTQCSHNIIYQLQLCNKPSNIRKSHMLLHCACLFKRVEPPKIFWQDAWAETCL